MARTSPSFQPCFVGLVVPHGDPAVVEGADVALDVAQVQRLVRAGRVEGRHVDRRDVLGRAVDLGRRRGHAVDRTDLGQLAQFLASPWS